jgi:ABC-type phosphate/phosphonate transport system substrate-binding protein
LRTLKESEPFPSGVLACYEGNLPAADARKLQAGLLAAKDNPRGQKALKSLRVSGFETLSDDYSSTLAAIIKAYPLPSK